jgi:eukaryotic-like serine/threonine-protein kinase
VIGQTVSHYRIVEQLGGGGMGVVYKADDTQLPRSAALKFLHEDATDDPKALERFRREVRVASALNHPNICTVYEIGEHEGKPFMAMEYLEGRTLKYIVGEPLPIADVLDYAIQIAKALEAAHSHGIVHRDIKPANIFVCADRHVKVLDFGIALMLSDRRRVLTGVHDSPMRTTVDGNLTTGSQVLGTASYMSPEQVRGEQLDARSDIFSLGVVIYELATGRTPFPGITVGLVLNAILEHDPVPATRLNPALPVEVQQIIDRCLEKRRDTRYQSAADLSADLRRIRLQIETGQHLRTEARAERTRRGLIATAVLLAVAAVLWLLLSRPPTPRLVSVTQLTNDGTSKTTPTVYYRVLTDGSRLYFTQLVGGSVSLAQVAVGGGRTVRFPATLPFSFPYLTDISPDHSRLLIIGFNGSESEAPIWTVPSVGGDAQRLGAFVGHDAAWHPDGSKITFANGHEIRSADNLGNNERVIATLPGTVRWLRWSPDGRILRFTVEDSSGSRSLWQKTRDHEPEPLLSATADAQICCGIYSPDGAYYVFQQLSGGRSDVAILQEARGLFRKAAPAQAKLTSGPLSFVAPLASADGSHLYAIGEQRRGELLRFDSTTRHWLPILPGISAEGVEFSPDGERVAFVSYPESTLWVMRKDGSARQQLTFPPMRAVLPRWSSNGRTLAFFAAAPGNKLRVFTIDPDAQGTQHEVAARERNERDPCWLGDAIVYSASDSPASPSLQNSRVFSFDPRTGQETAVPDSLGYFAPRCSPDGHYLTALRSDSNALALYDTRRKTWTTIATGPIGYVNWGRDSRHVFYDTFGNDASIVSVDIAARRTVRVAELSDVPRVWGPRGPWFGLDAHDAPLILRDEGSQEIYALEWEKQ